MIALWSSHLYRQTVELVLAALFSAGLFIFLFRKNNRHMARGWASVQSWLFAAPVILFVLGLKPAWAMVCLTLAAIIGAKIFFQITGMYHRSNFVWACYIGLICLGITTYYSRLDLYNLMPMIFLSIICLIPILRNSAKHMIQYISLSLIAFMLLGWGFLHMGLLLVRPQGAYLVIYITILSEFCDNIYLAASSFGRVRLFHRIHSKRTLEGFLIGFVATMLLAWGLRQMSLHPQLPIYWIVSGLVAALAGSLGDLVLSIIRRDLGIKDVGAFVLGRGDLLNGMDRLIFVAPIYYYAISYLDKVVR